MKETLILLVMLVVLIEAGIFFGVDGLMRILFPIDRTERGGEKEKRDESDSDISDDISGSYVSFFSECETGINSNWSGLDSDGYIQIVPGQYLSTSAVVAGEGRIRFFESGFIS